MVILVTGAMGFIGSHTVQALADLGHDCVATSHRTTRDLGAGITTEHVDIADHDAMRALGERYPIEGIIHLADPALTHLSDPTIDPAMLLGDIRTGAAALFNVLDCAITWDVRRLTVASTIGVYGGLPDLRGLSEEAPLPIAAGGNVVATSKKSAELLVSLFRERGVDTISARLPAVYGPRGRTQSRFFAAPGLIHSAVRGESPPPAYADDAIDLIYVKDCARAIAQLQTATQLTHSTYNIGSGRATSNTEVVAAIKRVLPGAHLPLEPGQSPHGTTAYLDTTRLHADTGFEPQYTLDRAVADYISWLTDDESGHGLVKPKPGAAAG